MLRMDKRRLALGIVLLGQLMMILDATIVNVALPAIKYNLHFSALVADLGAQRVPDRVRELLAAWRAARPVGSTRMFLVGIAIFTAASLLCGFAGSEAALIAARFVQGVGAATAAPPPCSR